MDSTADRIRRAEGKEVVEPVYDEANLDPATVFRCVSFNRAACLCETLSCLAHTIWFAVALAQIRSRQVSPLNGLGANLSISAFHFTCPYIVVVALFSSRKAALSFLPPSPAQREKRGESNLLLR